MEEQGRKWLLGILEISVNIICQVGGFCVVVDMTIPGQHGEACKGARCPLVYACAGLFSTSALIMKEKISEAMEAGATSKSPSIIRLERLGKIFLQTSYLLALSGLESFILACAPKEHIGIVSIVSILLLLLLSLPCIYRWF